MDILSFSDRYTWIHKVLVILNEGIPFMVLWHGNRTSTQLFHGRISRICFTLQYTSVGIVRFLDFANNDSLKFSPRGLEIEIRLFKVSENSMAKGKHAHLVQIVLLVDLLLNLAIHSKLE